MQRRLEALVAETQSSLSALQIELQETLVEKGLLIGSNKSLQDRIESLVQVMEQQKAMTEDRLAHYEVDRKAQMEAKQEEHERRVMELTGKIREVEQEMTRTKMVQVRNKPAFIPIYCGL